MKKKTVKVIVVCILIMFFGWMGNLFFGRYLTPTLIDSKIFSKLGIFDNDNKNTTIITKTEKVIVNEDISISEIASSAVYAVVDVLSFEKNDKNIKKINVSNNLGKYSKGVSGAGTILTNDGIVVTDRTNVVEKNADYKVVTFGGNVLDATLLGIDDFSNLAYLKVDGINLTTVPFANSDDNNSGKKVIFIGNLSGLQKAYLAEGTLSGFDESFNLAGGGIASSEKLEGVLEANFIEDDKYVGGPVINHSGELIAVSAKLEINNEKKYFQIPIDAISDSMQRVVENRIDQAAKLGIYYISVNPFYKNLKELTVDKGALIYSSSEKQGLAIIADSPAEKAELKLNDIILSIDGNEINPSHPLSNFINQYEKEDVATLNVLRDGKEMEIEVTF
ncbi:MAG: trypsin-like peptidase domain-containing protein [Parcubacteria group bacterium]|jgi:S1-C subfamily serine protease